MRQICLIPTGKDIAAKIKKMESKVLDVRWIFSPFDQIKVKLALSEMERGEFLEIFSECGKQFQEVCDEIHKLSGKIEQIDKITNHSGYPYDYRIRVLKQ